MNAEGRTQRVSSDLSGLLQWMSIVKAAYKDVLPSIDGLEVLALGNVQNLYDRLRQAEAIGFYNNSIHGRTGSNGSSFRDRVFVSIADSQMVDSPSLITHFWGDHELLFHTPEAQKPENINALRLLVSKREAAGKPLRIVWIENDSGQNNNIDEAVSVINRLQQSGIPAKLMLDLCHAIGAGPLLNADLIDDHFGAAWDQLMIRCEELKTMCGLDGEPIWQGVHVPIGTVKHDSLPIRETDPGLIQLSDDMLRNFGTILNQSDVRVVVIENQNDGVERFSLSPVLIHEHQKNQGIIFNRLAKTGILSLR